MTIVKDGLNTGDIVLSIQKFTFDQFNASGMPLPVELDPDITGQPFPDPADLCKYCFCCISHFFLTGQGFVLEI